MTEEELDRFIKEVVWALGEIQSGDKEVAHDEADGLLLGFLEEIGHSDVAEGWRAVAERCNGFWYA